MPRRPKPALGSLQEGGSFLPPLVRTGKLVSVGYEPGFLFPKGGSQSLQREGEAFGSFRTQFHTAATTALLPLRVNGAKTKPMKSVLRVGWHAQARGADLWREGVRGQ